MALGKKRSRRITVDDVGYRWRESHGAHAMELRVELFATPGAVLLVEVPYLHLNAEYPSFVYRPVFTNRIVAAVIREALTQGWEPASHAGRLHLAGEEGARFVTTSDYRECRDVVRSGDRYV